MTKFVLSREFPRVASGGRRAKARLWLSGSFALPFVGVSIRNDLTNGVCSMTDLYGPLEIFFLDLCSDRPAGEVADGDRADMSQ